MSHKSSGIMWLLGGSAVAGVSLWLAKRKVDNQEASLREAVETGNVSKDAPSSIVHGAQGPKFAAHLTGYWPFTARPDERKMEGGLNDRLGKPLHTLEMHQRDPQKYPYVSVSGDDAIFPYGQRLSLNVWPGLVFRVVDTGGHFRGTGKVYRVMGEEPLDICVDSSKTIVPKKGVVATIHVGDTLSKRKEVSSGGFKGQTVSAGDVIGSDLTDPSEDFQRDVDEITKREKKT